MYIRKRNTYTQWEKDVVMEQKRYTLWALSNLVPQNSTACLQIWKCDNCLDEWTAGYFSNILRNGIGYQVDPILEASLFGELFPTMVQISANGLLLKHCSEPYLTLQLTQGAILHPLCRVGCGRSCWDGRCELFGQASPEPASLWERGSQSQAALLPS